VKIPSAGAGAGSGSGVAFGLVDEKKEQQQQQQPLPQTLAGHWLNVSGNIMQVGLIYLLLPILSVSCVCSRIRRGALWAGTTFRCSTASLWASSVLH
jgi:hypothetical protein